jgi:hypothetical protein
MTTMRTISMGIRAYRRPEYRYSRADGATAGVEVRLRS